MQLRSILDAGVVHSVRLCTRRVSQSPHRLGEVLRGCGYGFGFLLGRFCFDVVSILHEVSFDCCDVASFCCEFALLLLRFFSFVLMLLICLYDCSSTGLQVPLSQPKRPKLHSTPRGPKSTSEHSQEAASYGHVNRRGSPKHQQEDPPSAKGQLCLAPFKKYKTTLH